MRIGPPYSPRALGNFFIGRGIEDQNPADPMKVQKLVYIAHGRCLADRGLPLVSERVKAWVWGPVIPSLYHDLKSFGHRPIMHPIFALPEQQFCILSIPLEDETTLDLLRRVWRTFSHHSAKTLSALTHVAGSPWFVARERAGVGPDTKSDIEIEPDLIASFFKKNFRC